MRRQKDRGIFPSECYRQHLAIFAETKTLDKMRGFLGASSSGSHHDRPAAVAYSGGKSDGIDHERVALPMPDRVSEAARNVIGTPDVGMAAAISVDEAAAVRFSADEDLLSRLNDIEGWRGRHHHREIAERTACQTFRAVDDFSRSFARREGFIVLDDLGPQRRLWHVVIPIGEISRAWILYKPHP